MQDAGIIEISTKPEAYARYLAMQGDIRCTTTGLLKPEHRMDITFYPVMPFKADFRKITIWR